jgi:hypothetical protein
MIPCGHCLKPTKPVFERGVNVKKYCSKKCRRNAWGMRHYHRVGRYDTNRSARYAERARKWREKQRELGNCTRCGRPNDTSDSTCSDCRGLYK